MVSLDELQVDQEDHDLGNVLVDVRDEPVIQEKYAARDKVAGFVNLFQENCLSDTACSDVVREVKSLVADGIKEYKQSLNLGGDALEGNWNLPTLSALNEFGSTFKFKQYVKRHLPVTYSRLQKILAQMRMEKFTHISTSPFWSS